MSVSEIGAIAGANSRAFDLPTPPDAASNPRTAARRVKVQDLLLGQVLGSDLLDLQGKVIATSGSTVLPELIVHIKNPAHRPDFQGYVTVAVTS
jgi:hypothetical protein